MASNNILLQILTRSIPYLSKTSTTLANRLILDSREMIGRPVGTDSIVKPVACLAAATRCITKDYKAILGLLAGAVGEFATTVEKADHRR